MMLLTKRLNIHHYTASELEDFLMILTDDRIMKGIRGKGYSTKIAREKFNEALTTNGQCRTLGYFNVTLIGTQQLVGFAKLVLMDDQNLEVGYALLEKCWGLGYASEITAALVRHARKTYPEKEVIGIVNRGNKASSHVLLKQNFERRNTATLDGFEVAYYYLSK